MRCRISNVAATLCVFVGFARGDLLKSDYSALHNLEQEFGTLKSI